MYWGTYREPEKFRKRPCAGDAGTAQYELPQDKGGSSSSKSQVIAKMGIGAKSLKRKKTQESWDLKPSKARRAE